MFCVPKDVDAALTGIPARCEQGAAAARGANTGRALFEATMARLKPFVRLTPLIGCQSLFNQNTGTEDQESSKDANSDVKGDKGDDGRGRRVLLKCENFQRTGSFKIRGATNAVLTALQRAGSLDEAHTTVTHSTSSMHFVTHSSGNHGQALALAAMIGNEAVRRKGSQTSSTTPLPVQCSAHVVVPHNAPRSKLAAMRTYKADVVLCEPTLAAREAACGELLTRFSTTDTPHSDTVAANAAVLVHPFDDPLVIAGQGTIAVELLDQLAALSRLEDLAAVVVPVGGGGLVSGVACAMAALRPGVPVIGAEPLLANDAARSLRGGSRTTTHLDPATGSTVTTPATVADGLRTLTSSRTHALITKHVAGIAEVPETQIAQAFLRTYERAKIVIEPSAAVGIAAVMFNLHPLLKAITKGTIVVVVCGGNVDLADISSLRDLALKGHDGIKSNL